MNITYYPSNIDCYRKGDIVAWTKSNGLDYVLELHLNAFNGKALGTELLIYSGFNDDQCDRAINNACAKFFVNRGIKKRNNLANMNRMAAAGKAYSLLEICFVDNCSDVKKYQNIVNDLGESIYKELSKLGIKKLGIVYGHGQGDPGAVGCGTKEETEARRLKIKSNSGSSGGSTSTTSSLVHTFKSNNNRMYYFPYSSANCEIVVDRYNKYNSDYKYSNYNSKEYPRYVIKFKNDVKCYKDVDLKLADATIKKGTVLFTDNINDLEKGM